MLDYAICSKFPDLYSINHIIYSKLTKKVLAYRINKLKSTQIMCSAGTSNQTLQNIRPQKINKNNNSNLTVLSISQFKMLQQ